MKSRLLPLAGLLPFLLGGCNVGLPISEAVAVPISDEEAARLDDGGARPTTPGQWFEVRVTLSREAVRKIARWELYTHMRVEDCRTGDLAGIASSVGIQGTEGDFVRIRQQLRTDEKRQTFVIAEPVFFRSDKRLDQLCVRLEGGSYTLQKISNSPVVLRVQRRET